MLYFLDTEFDGFGGALLSLALVRADGTSLYMILPGAELGARDPWVRENVVPILRDVPKAVHVSEMSTRKIAANTIANFLAGDKAPNIVSDWPDDHRHLCELVITGPGQMVDIPRWSMVVDRVDAYPTELPGAVQHNAWWDAMALRFLLTGMGL